MRHSLAVLAAVLTVLLAGCAEETAPAPADTASESPSEEPTTEEPAAQEEPPSPCSEAFAAAAAVDDMQDVHADLWPAFDACASIKEFTAASKEHPDALDGANPTEYATNQCLYEPEVKGSAVCRSL